MGGAHLSDKETTTQKECPKCGGDGRVVKHYSDTYGFTFTDSVCPACEGTGKEPEEKMYVVSVSEVWVRKVQTMAKSADEAIGKVSKGEGQCLDNAPEYCYSLESGIWTAEVKE